VSSLKRMLSVLDLFTPEHPVCTADEVAEHLKYSRGTSYRYIRELCAAGLLARTASGFTLGPRIPELDRAIRDCDPTLIAAQAPMKSLRDRFECDILLVRFFDDRVIVSHHEQGPDQLQVSYGRGRVMPLFRGAGSKALLAALPYQRQHRLFREHKDAVAQAGMGEDWRHFRATLMDIDRAGVAVSLAELDAGNVGVAAPIPGSEPSLPSALVMVVREQRYAVLDKAQIADAVRDAAGQIGGPTA
jgi:DNA-binding IclR family transcriptional regulator